MARIFPTEITAAEVADLLAALDRTRPYISDDWKTASFDFDALDLTVSVKLENRAYDAEARRAVGAAAAMLPHFQEWVVALHEPDGPNDGSDDHGLGMLKVDGDEVYLHYVAISYNSTWGQSFRKGCSGLWYPHGDNTPLPEPPPPCRAIDPAWLAWNGGTVQKVARAIRDDRGFERMPILADALQEAGCGDDDILAHCREPGEHGRGCWVLGLVLKHG